MQDNCVIWAKNIHTDYLAKHSDYLFHVSGFNGVSAPYTHSQCFIFHCFVSAEARKSCFHSRCLTFNVSFLLNKPNKHLTFCSYNLKANIIHTLFLFVVIWNKTKLSPDDRWWSTFQDFHLQDFPLQHQADQFSYHFACFSIFLQRRFYVTSFL